MTYDPRVHHRRSIRLRGYDYAGGGAYFITLCVEGKSFLLGEVVESEMLISEGGRIVEATWRAFTSRFPSVVLDARQVMPNHFHGIVVIPGLGLAEPLAKATGAPVIQPCTVGPGLAPAGPPQGAALQTTNEAGASLGPTRVSLGNVVGAFKSLSAIAVNRALKRTGKHLWQEDYYEHIIRDVKELELIRDYIRHNPVRWYEDPENPDK